MFFKSLSLLAISLVFVLSDSDNKTSGKNTKLVSAPVSKELYKEISGMDSMMFVAFNEQNTNKLMSYFTADLEFYHDKGGLSDFNQTKEGFKKLFENNKTTGLRRDLIAGSFEVYPIHEYGAIETCLHRFCHLENGKNDCGTFKNIMIWKKVDGNWKVSRVISYDH